MRSGPFVLMYGVPDQSINLDTTLPFIRVDNPTNARVKFLDIRDEVGPYTMDKVLPWGISGTAKIDTSDVSYPNVNIFNGGVIVVSPTNEETASPGVLYAPIATINNTVNITGNITGSVTVSNTINATITNASIAVTQVGTWNIAGSVSITNASIPITGSVTVSGTVAISNASIAVSGNVTFLNTSIGVQNVGGTQLSVLNPQTLLGTVDVLDVGSNTVTFTLPVGCHSIALIYAQTTSPNPPGGGWGSPSAALVRGVTTGAIFFNVLQVTSGGYDVFNVEQATDTQITVKLTNPNLGTARAWVVGLQDSASVDVSNTPASPVYVASVAGSFGVMIRDANNASILLGQTTKINSLPVTLASDQPAIPVAGIDAITGTWITSYISTNAGSGVAQLLLGANANRRGVIIWAEHLTGMIDINVGAGNIRTLQLPPKGYWEMPRPISTAQINTTTNTAGQGGVIIVTEIT